MNTKNTSASPDGAKRRRAGGKPLKLTFEQVRDALRASGGNLTSAAMKLSVERGTVYDYLTRYPDLARIRQEADEIVTDLAEATVVTAIRNQNLGVAQWWLNRKARGRGFGEAVELTGEGGGPIQTAVNVKVTFVRPEPEEDD